ncbi:hypothetical protein [Marisediminicola senii]|uniref:hypothetical protein n=1 Tax=Marisediminicola senii TaxID=2711233 RepID=UPI0013EB3DB3|nr:hypothetical protein [Marisediminicola senii]
MLTPFFVALATHDAASAAIATYTAASGTSVPAVIGITTGGAAVFLLIYVLVQAAARKNMN